MDIYIIVCGECSAMPIRYFLKGRQFDTDTVRLMGLAFESVRVALDVVDRDDPVNQHIAEKIITLAQRGERDPEQICLHVLADIRRPPPAG
jgi:hypothetical protein